MFDFESRAPCQVASAEESIYDAGKYNHLQLDAAKAHSCPCLLAHLCLVYLGSKMLVQVGCRAFQPSVARVTQELILLDTSRVFRKRFRQGLFGQHLSDTTWAWHAAERSTIPAYSEGETTMANERSRICVCIHTLKE